jgi:phage terminase large subunit-like protein
MNISEKIEYLRILEELERRNKYRLIDSYYPDKGPLRRELYKKHLEFFAAGNDYDERLILAANRIGKTEAIGGYELTCHLTGIYPKWWPGRKFNRPIEAWACGKTGQTVRDIIQKKLLGPSNDIGTGLLKPEFILDTTPRRGVPEAIDTVKVKHTSGGVSELGFKSYDQKRQSFEGTKKDVVWLDEESPLDIYTECLLRTTDTSGLNLGNGMILFTFTPLLGLSEVVLQFLPGGEINEIKSGSKCVIMASWSDVPHLTEEVKAKMMASIPAFQRDARSKGIPQLGSGAIYPVPESDIVVPDFAIPKHWPRGYGMDVGWNRTSVGFHAWDRENDIVYRYSEHYRGQAEPSIHAEAIKARGKWLSGVIDPASRGRSQADGLQLIQTYTDLGLDLDVAFNGVESGIYEMWQRLSTGRYKVFASCNNWLSEYRIYRRDEKGRVVKGNDHCFSGETLVATNRGDVRIDKIKPGDMVYTRAGFRRVIDAWCNGTREVIDLGAFQCTPEHPIYTLNRGFVRADSLIDADRYVTISEWQNQSYFKARRIAYTVVRCITVAVRLVCMFKFGVITLAQSLKECMFIIKTVIGQITELKTLNLSRLANICLITLKKCTLIQFSQKSFANIWKEFRKKLRNGIVAKRAAHGMDSTLAAYGAMRALDQLSCNVFNAIKNLRQLLLTLPLQNFVAIIANQMPAESLESITKQEIVANAANNLAPINIPKVVPVDASAEANYKAEHCKTEQKLVYDLLVEDAHEFFANGILVSNCMDESRYFIMSGLERCKVEPIDEKQNVRFREHGSSSDGWMA